jgi:DNA-binding transcriptional LysR family regulator
MLDIHRLRVFLAVCEAGSFSQAASRIHLSQPTVSGHIKTLEEHLGTPLFNRRGKKVILTKAGQMLHPRARQIVSIAESMERQMAMFLGLKKGRLEIGGSNVPGQYILPGLISRFKEGKEGIQIRVRIGDTLSISDLVANGDIETGIVGAVIPNRELDFTPCFSDELVAAVPRGHPMATARDIDPAELAKEPFIIREKGSGTRKTMEKILEQYDLPPLSSFNIVAELGSAEAIRQAVKAGAGCAIISRRVIHDDIVHGAVSSPAIKGMKINRRFHLVTRKQGLLSPLAENFRNFLLSMEEKNITI